MCRTCFGVTHPLAWVQSTRARRHAAVSRLGRPATISAGVRSLRKGDGRAAIVGAFRCLQCSKRQVNNMLIILQS